MSTTPAPGTSASAGVTPEPTAGPGQAAGGSPAAEPPSSTPAECDLIMKGGITSGVVYPMAVCELADHYRFRRIGGSSAGAIAAALTAAAEYGRTFHNGNDGAGFQALNGIPRLLTNGDTLFQLFRPTASTAAIFKFLMTLLDRTHNLASRLVQAAWIIVRSVLPLFLLVLLVGLVPGLLVGRWLAGGHRWPSVWLSLLVWLPPALLLALSLAAAAAALRAIRRIDQNGFGLAMGHDGADAAQPGQTPPLTDWLTDQINVVAGRMASDPPITYGDLWDDRATAWYLSKVGADDGSPRLTDLQRFDPGFDPQIDLLVMTTCLTLGLPFTFPFADDTFHYCPSCMADYFPRTVTDHLDAHARPAGPWSSNGRPISTDCPRHPGVAVRRFPQIPDIPVVIAARLSLSFPVLISAIPLYYVDFDKVPDQRGLVTAWFSDGGITSNFPIHFFDAPLPSRPTFGINLAAVDARYPNNDVFMPPATGTRSPRETPLTTLPAFLNAVMRTMQNWPDTMQASAPGFRDRIVEVYLPADEGGLNLRMTTNQINALTDRGRRAGDAALKTFDFQTHRWSRFRVLMNGLSVSVERTRRAYPLFDAEIPSPWTGAYHLPAHTERELRDEASQVVAMATAWQADAYPATTEPPSPEPQLRFDPHR